MSAFIYLFSLVVDRKNSLYIPVFYLSLSLHSLRMRTDSISFLLMKMTQISAFAYFPSARSIGSHLMSVWSQMNGLVKFLVGVLTTSHHVIYQDVLVRVCFSVFLCAFAVLPRPVT